MIKILTLGVLVSGFVWFFVSEDRVRSYIEWDLEKQLSEAVTEDDKSKVSYTVAGRDVIIQQRDAADPQDITLIREQIYSVPGVNRVLQVDAFQDQTVIRNAISALSGAKNKTLFASVQFSEDALTLTGNVAAPAATTEVLAPLTETLGLRVNNYLSFHSEIPPRRWLTFLNAFAKLQPLDTAGAVLITDEGISIFGEDQSLVQQVPRLLKADGVDLPMRIVNMDGEAAEDSPLLLAGPSVAECNEELAGIVSGNPIAFNQGSDDLRPDSVLTVQAVAELTGICEGLLLLVEGHTDNKGTAEYNRRLSLRRANAVRAKLQQNGVNESLIESVGVGEQRPIVSNGTLEGRRQNRRIELKFLTIRSSSSEFGANNRISAASLVENQQENSLTNNSLDSGAPDIEAQATVLQENSTAPSRIPESAVEYREIPSSVVNDVPAGTVLQRREVFFEERRVE